MAQQSPDVCATSPSLTSVYSVVLDCHPVFTTAIILVGWAIKTAVAGLVSGWVGLVTHGDYDTPGEIWLAYSIP